MADLTPVPLDPVLGLLAPRLAKYLQRAGPAAPDPVVQSDDHGYIKPLADPPVEHCLVEALVTIDPGGRIPWRSGGNERTTAIAAIEVSGDIIEVLAGTPRGSVTHTPDKQGRLHIPRGLLRLIEVGPGDRLAVLRLPHQRGLGLISIRRLGIRGRGG